MREKQAIRQRLIDEQVALLKNIKSQENTRLETQVKQILIFFFSNFFLQSKSTRPEAEWVIPKGDKSCAYSYQNFFPAKKKQYFAFLVIVYYCKEQEAEQKFLDVERQKIEKREKLLRECQEHTLLRVIICPVQIKLVVAEMIFRSIKNALLLFFF